MKIFLCWSGARSKQIAGILRNWLPNVIQGLKPWMSEEDIKKGEKWASELGEELQSTNFGIVCLTPENKSDDWILFEAGSLSKQIKGSYVVPYLFGLNPSDLTGPFALFQVAKSTKEDTLRVINSINDAQVDNKLTSQQIHSSFEKWWPDLERELSSLPEPEDDAKAPERSNEDILEEILIRVRNLPREVTRIVEISRVPSKYRQVKAFRDEMKLLLTGMEDLSEQEISIILAGIERGIPAFISDLEAAMRDLPEERLGDLPFLLLEHFVSHSISKRELVKSIQKLHLPDESE